MNEILQKKFVQIFIMQLVQLFLVFKEKLANALRIKFLLIKFKRKKIRKITIIELNDQKQKMNIVNVVNVVQSILTLNRSIRSKNFEINFAKFILLFKSSSINFYIKVVVNFSNNDSNLFRIKNILLDDETIINLLSKRIIVAIKKLHQIFNLDTKMKIANDI